MKVRGVKFNNRAKQLELTTYAGAMFPFPYARLKPQPTRSNPLVDVHVDRELAREAVTYRLRGGEEQSVLLDEVLHHNEDPNYMLRLLQHQLSVEAQKHLKTTDLSLRAIARVLRTSPAQIYRLVDPANTTKNLNNLIKLLQVLGVKVDVKLSGHNTQIAS